MKIKFENLTKEDCKDILKMFQGLVYKYEDLKSIDIEKILKWEERKLNEKIGEYFSI